MKNIALLFLLAFSWSLSAQSPQFAVVRPNGTTTIWPTWTAAYDAAQDDDFMYLPGGVMQHAGDILIDKRLHIYGAGHHPDSSSTMGSTQWNNTTEIYSGASGGSIEGIYFTSLRLGNNSKLQNYTIERCRISNVLAFINSNNESVPEFITVAESIVSSISTSDNFPGSGVENSFFSKNIFTGVVTGATNPPGFGRINYCVFRNNIFLGQSSFLFTPYVFGYIGHSYFENNIIYASFPSIFYSGCGTNFFYNNLKVGTNPMCSNSLIEGTIHVDSPADIFIDGNASNTFSYDRDFHLHPDCPGVGAGTDGTDVGIYGTNNPTPEGWVPSNPHIYLKQIDGETGVDGKLHVKIGVRTNN